MKIKIVVYAFFALIPFLGFSQNIFPTNKGGHVGIGTLSPKSPLTIESANDAITTYKTTDNTWLYTNWLDKDNLRRMYMGLSSDLSSFIIQTQNGTNKILLNGGNVGIGTNDPKENFQIGTAFVFHDGGHEVLAFHHKPGGEEDLDKNKYAAEIRFDPVNGLLRLGTSSSLTSNPITRLSISKGGNVEVNGNISVGINSSDINTGDNTYGNKLFFLGAYPNTDDLWMARYNVSKAPNSSEIRVNIGDDLHYSRDKFSIGVLNGDWHPRFVVQGDGNVGIGTNSPDSKLTVKGNIHAQEVKVDLAGAVAPDYVFKEGYDLKTLEEVETHIQKEGHLPNIPSAEEMEEDGINLKEMNLKLLEKVEELTLYVIGQQKSMKLQEEKFNNQIKELKIELNNLKGR